MLSSGKNDLQKKINLKHSEDYYIKILLRTVMLEDIMSRPVISVPVETPFYQIPQKFQEHTIRHLPIVNRTGQVVGLITERDLFKIQPPKQLIDGCWQFDRESLTGIILDHVMVRDVFCMGLRDCMGDALVAMARNKYGCIPVVDEKQVLRGIITQQDILNVAAQVYLE